MGQRVVFTGGSGKAGRHVIPVLLARGHTVLNVDLKPLDQPGVELGKQFTYAMLGRADSAAAREEWGRLPRPSARWQI